MRNVQRSARTLTRPRRWVAGSIAVVTLWSGPAAAVIHSGTALTATGAPVAGASFVGVIDNGETDALDWDPQTRTCSHRRWGRLITQTRDTLALVPRVQYRLAEALTYRDEFRSTFEQTTGTR